MAPGGYLWWYVDALSDDGRHGLTIIAFVGSVFSPYYAWARRGTGIPDPQAHCALNVALYGPGGRWAMTERSARQCTRAADSFVIGPSRVHWSGQCLQIDIDEVCVPIPRRVRGQVRLYPQRLFDYSVPIDAQGRHRWGPIAPTARVEVEMQAPALRWQGQAYLDSNEGDEPIVQACREWDWSRALMADGSTAVIYDVQNEDGSGQLLARRFGLDGAVTDFDAPPRQAMPRTGWALSRRLRSASAPRVVEQLEDTPFYQRAIVSSQLLGETVTSFH